MGEATTILACPAKLNLALAVGPVQAGGYHPIASWMVRLRLGDTLSVRRLEAGPSRLSLHSAADAPRPVAVDWPVQRDLAWRAHQLLEAELGRALPMEATIEKRIPAGAGLGGGSSDAGAMLVGLNALFDLGLSVEQLSAMGGRLGSDVPFAVHAASGAFGAVVRGRGARVEPLERVPSAAVVLILPELHCGTAAVYGAFDELTDASHELDERRVVELAEAGRVAGEALFNDLAAAAERVQPRLGRLRVEAGELIGLPVHITGSGAAMFAVVETQQAAEAMAERVRDGLGVAAVATTIG